MFEQLFKKKASSASVKTELSMHAAAAPGTEVVYHADLVEHFLGHHASLRKVFATIRVQAAANRFSDAENSLQTFRRVFTAHLLEENVKLYTYLSKCLIDDEGSREAMLDMRAEMMRIGKSVMGFVGRFATSGINVDNRQRFLTEVDAIGEVLADRMEREESSLYTMYMPPEAFS